MPADIFTYNDNDYTLGRGTVYFDPFDVNGNPTGERYVGNTPGISVNSTYQTLDHFSSDFGTRTKDDTIDIQTDRGGSIQTDNMSDQTLGWMFGTTPLVEAQASVVGETERFVLKLGAFYQLGADEDMPQGIGAVTNVVMNDNTGAHAGGTANFNGNPSNNNTFTLNGVVVTFVTGTPTGNQVQIGGSAQITAQSLKQFINDHPDLFLASASGTGILLTFTAYGTGVEGNSISLARSGSFPTVSGANLSGGTASGVITGPGNYEVDLTLGRIHILPGSTVITDGQTVEVRYNVPSGTRTVIIDQGVQVEGALRYIADNPKGTDRIWYWPRIKLSPNGDLALKGDTWETVTFNFEVLVKGKMKRVYISPK